MLLAIGLRHEAGAWLHGHDPGQGEQPRPDTCNRQCDEKDSRKAEGSLSALKGENEMAQIGYSKKVMEHFMNPRNVGVIENPDGYGQVGNPVCGDLMEIFIKVKDDKVDDIKFRTFGCGSAIAVSSMVTEMAKGKTLDEAMMITRKDVADELDGLPPQKMHCSNLGADALHAAIKNYWVKIGKIKPEEAKPRRATRAKRGRAAGRE